MVSTGFYDHEELPFNQGPKASTVLLPQGVGVRERGGQEAGAGGWWCRIVILNSEYKSYSEGLKLGSLLMFSPYL